MSMSTSAAFKGWPIETADDEQAQREEDSPPALLTSNPQNPPGSERVCEAVAALLEALDDALRLHGEREGEDCDCGCCEDMKGIRYANMHFRDSLESLLAPYAAMAARWRKRNPVVWEGLGHEAEPSEADTAVCVK